MKTQPLSDVLDFIHNVASLHSVQELTDGQLVERFAAERDEAAFAALLQRHAPLVFGVCQRVLHNVHDAEDAFQATFLVLGSKCRSIVKRESVASWLHGVAYRIATRARIKTSQRRLREGSIQPESVPDCIDEVVRRDLSLLIDEEVRRLPERYRTSFVLCYMEGKSNEEVAKLLRCPLGTVLSRLARARQRLRSCLVRRGLTLSAGLIVTMLSQSARSAAVPRRVLRATVRAALCAGPTPAAMALLPAWVTALVQGSARLGLAAPVKWTAVACLLTALIGLGKEAVLHQHLPKAGEATKGMVLERGAHSAAQAREPTPQPDRVQSGLQAVLQALAGIENPERRVEALLGIARMQSDAGYRRAARATLEQARSVAATIPDEKIKSFSLENVVRVQVHLEDMQGAKVAADTIKDDLAKVFALTEIAKAQAKRGDRSTAEKTFEEALVIARVIPDSVDPRLVSKEVQRLSALQYIAAGQADAGNRKAALAIAGILEAHGGKAWDTWETWRQIAASQARAGDFKGARAFVQKMKDDHARQMQAGTVSSGESSGIENLVSSLLRELSILAARNGDLKSAAADAAAISDAHERNRCLWFLARTQAEAGQDSAAERTAESIAESGERALAFQFIARARAKRGHSEAARKLLQQVLDLAATAPDQAAAVESLLLVAEARAELGDLEGARQAAEAIRDANFCTPNFELLYDMPFQIMVCKNSAFMLMSRALSRKGDVEGAIKAADAIADDPRLTWWPEQARAYCDREIARAQAQAGKIKEALARAKSRNGSLAQSAALQGVAEGLLKGKLLTGQVGS